MAIYTRYGSVVTITEMRLIPVWIERHPSEIRWHYKRPEKAPKTSVIEETPIWFYRGKYENGEDVCDGKWVTCNDLRADDGWKEIETKMAELNPEDIRKFNEWNKVGAPNASHFFNPELTRNIV